MADTTITVKLDGTPLEGAEVISSGGEIDEAYTTDANGKVTIDLAIGYANCVLVAVRHSSIPITAYIATCILEGGRDYEINIPDYGLIEEGGGAIRGIHSHFIAEV